MKDKVVVFDLDGTLLNASNEIIGGEQTIAALNTLRNLGCTLAICTGRLDHDIIKINQKYDLNIINRISQNGAVCIKDKDIEALLIDKEEALSIYSYLSTKNIRIELNTISNRYWNTERDPLFPKELYDSHRIIDDYKELILCQPAVLFLLVGEQKELTDIAECINSHYQQTKAILTSQTSLEVLHKDASKGMAIKKLYPDYCAYTIGDSPSDFDMFPISKKAYLVSDVDCSYECIRTPSILEALQDIIDDIK